MCVFSFCRSGFEKEADKIMASNYFIVNLYRPPLTVVPKLVRVQALFIIWENCGEEGENGGLYQFM
jgi:hypothetical protein